jgi:hypothetical protein
MIEFIFNYNDKQIKYSIDLLGRERVYVDTQLVAKPTNWFNSVSEVEITVDEEKLKLSRLIRSYTDGEYQVTLSNQQKIIDKQAKLVIDLSMTGKETVYRGEEVDWLEEVKLPQGIIYCAWALYFGIIINVFVSEFIENVILSDISAWTIVTFASASAGLFFYWTVKALVSNPKENAL